MKAITLHQPWASLITDGRKLIETRPRPWHYVGDVAIHAGLKVDSVACAQFGYEPDAVPRGAIVAVAYMTGCGKFTATNVTPDPYGDYTPGRYGYFLEKIRKLHTPIKERGYQGIWEWFTGPCFKCKQQMPEGGLFCPHCDWKAV